MSVRSDERMHRFAIAGLLVVIAGCSQEKSARERFATDKTCPIDRVTATEKVGESAHDLIWGPPKKPPPEIAADPARLALWQKQEDASKKSWDKATRVWEVTGCNETQLYTCMPSSKRMGANCTSVRPYKP